MRLSFLLALGLASPISLGWAQKSLPSQAWDVQAASVMDASLHSASASTVWQDGEEPAEKEQPKKEKAQDGDSPDKNSDKKQSGEKGSDSKDADAKEASAKKEAQDDDKKEEDDKKADDKKKDKKSKAKDKEEEKSEPLQLAEPSGPTLFVKGAKVIVRPGKVLENAQVIIRDGRILNVGTDLVAPEGARVLEGTVVCAGFLDPFSTMGLDNRSLNDSGSFPSAKTADALNFYGPSHASHDALKAGVLIVESHIGGNAVFGGTGVFLRTGMVHDLEKAMLSEPSAMWARLERTGNVIDRVEEVDGLVSRLESGMDYLKSWRTYDTKLEEWKKEISELQEKLEKDFKKAKKDREKDLKKAEKDGKKFKEKSHKEPKPPKMPRFDADKEILGHVAEGKMPLVVVASRAAVLRNLLDATKDFGRLRLVIAGGDQAMHVAPQLASRKIPVIVWPAAPLGNSSKPSDTVGSLELAGDLARAGIPVVIGSGLSGESSALPLYASLAVGYGLPEEHGLAAITTRAAAAFGMQNELGQVRRGRRAEILILNGDPLAVGTQVQFAISGGEVVLEPQE